ncbi:MAG TPA: hypothetical protein VF498_12400 [Anaerolineales bacterium]
MNDLLQQFRLTLSDSERPAFDQLAQQVETWLLADRAGGQTASTEKVLLSLLWEQRQELERLKRLLAGI